MMEILKTVSELDITVRIPGLRHVLVVKSPQKSKLGIDFCRGDGKTLLIQSLNPGLIADWNAKQSDEIMVRPDDIITEVNGIGGDAQKILAEIAASNVLELAVVSKVCVTKQILLRKTDANA